MSDDTNGGRTRAYQALRDVGHPGSITSTWRFAGIVGRLCWDIRPTGLRHEPARDVSLFAPTPFAPYAARRSRRNQRRGCSPNHASSPASAATSPTISSAGDRISPCAAMSARPARVAIVTR